MKRTVSGLLILFLAGMLTACAGKDVPEQSGDKDVSGPPVAVAKEIQFDNRAGVRLEVKRQCKLETKVPKFVNYYGPEHGVNVELVDDLEATDIDRKVEILITQVHAPGGGGMFAGDMWMRVKATLYEDGKEVAVAHVKRETSGGYWDEFKSTCAIIGRCTEAIGDDIASWLKNPEDGVYIGNWPNRQPHPSSYPTPGTPNPPGPL